MYKKTDGLYLHWVRYTFFDYLCIFTGMFILGISAGLYGYLFFLEDVAYLWSQIMSWDLRWMVEGFGFQTLAERLLPLTTRV